MSDESQTPPDETVSTENSGATISSELSGLVIESITAKPKKRKRRSRRRTNWCFLLVVLSLIAIWAIHVFVVPPIALSYHRLFFPKRFPPAELDMPFASRSMLRSCEFLFVFWFFFFGACIGSFFNVVASRLPKGRSIVFGGSMCPFCSSHLNILDNMPFFGWIGLRGRCRTCRLPISPRYLIIEIIVGLVFMTLAIVELISSGANLPHRVTFHGGGLVSTVFFPQWDLIGASLTHAMLFAVLIMLTASHMEGLGFPRRSMIVIGVMFSVAVIFSPLLNCISWKSPFVRVGYSMPVDRVVAVLLGAIVSGVVSWGTGRVLLRCMHGRTGELSTDSLGANEALEFTRNHEASLSSNFGYHWVAMHTLIGVVTGWQTAVSIAVFGAIAAWIALKLVQDKSMSWIAAEWLIQRHVFALSTLISFALIHHFLWRQIALFAGL